MRVFSGQRRRLSGFGALGVLGLMVLSGCGDDDAAPTENGDGATGTAAPSPGPPPGPPSLPEVSAPGTGTVVVGGSAATFTVTDCSTEADPDQPEGAQVLLHVDGEGTTEAGIAFTVEVTRFATGTDIRTFTDSIAYADTARILHAQRIEVAGQVTDLRDETATSALLSPRDDGVAGRGMAGPPGSAAGDEGLIGIALDATC